MKRGADLYHFAGFTLDPQRAELRGPDGVEIKLRRKTAEMLQLFVGNAGRVVSKQELLDAIWPNVHVSEDSLFQCIRELRTALGDDERQTIKLVTGRGYLFAAEVTAGAAAEAPTVEVPLPPAVKRRRPLAIAAGAALCVVIVAAAAFVTTGLNPARPVVAVLPIAERGAEPQDAAMAAAVTGLLVEGFARIENIRVLAPRRDAAVPASEFVIRGELQRGAQGWTLQARMIKTATGEVETVATVSVALDNGDEKITGDEKIVPSRLAAGVGHQLAQRLNKLLESPKSTFTPGDASTAKAAIEQATASINQTTRERFGMAQTMLRNALDAEPDNIDVAVALAALQMRGIQMVWYSPADAAAAEAQADATLGRALKARPNSIAVLETYCRFQSATNRFVDSLVTCTRALDFDPWNGLSLFLIGLGQIHLGRFDDALATFIQADSYDTPDVSRWTWLIGAGWAYISLGRYEEGLPWLKRSIAITPASGRPQMLLAAAYQALGRVAEAQAAMKQGLAIRPGTTALTVPSPWTNASPIFINRSNELIRLMVAAGLPEK